MATNLLDRIKWLGHDGFEIGTDGVTLMIDPFQVGEGRQADIILVTHPHFDHCSVDDIARIRKPSTVIVTEPESAEKLSAANLSGDIRIVKPGDSLTVSGILIEAVAAYNMDKHFHPKEKNWLGFIITIGGVRVYHAGDTDLIPEMNGLSADIALLPVSGTYVMTAGEAVAAARRIKPKTAMPMHYGSIVGTPSDALAFKAALADTCDIVIPERG
ncbi:MAG: MBL fold metallo-hydrolase [Deltaproteobacteria bacterium]|nr:MBL fold metallo-hydrolase [Deltaproteobacteria bacterium]